MLHMVSQEADLLKKVIIMHANITLLDLLAWFHYILNPLVVAKLEKALSK